jgi:mRNA interferase HigB
LRIIAHSTLTAYAKRHPDAAKALHAWSAIAESVHWKNASEVKKTLGNASIINAERVVFNIAGNKHRLIVAIHYDRSVIFVKFIGTHAEYDRINAATIQYGDHP